MFFKQHFLALLSSLFPKYSDVKPEKDSPQHPGKYSLKGKMASAIEMSSWLSSTFQQNQDTPQGALKLLSFWLPKDIQTVNDFFPSFPFFPHLLAEWQVQRVTNRACNMLQICQGWLRWPHLTNGCNREPELPPCACLLPIVVLRDPDCISGWDIWL